MTAAQALAQAVRESSVCGRVGGGWEIHLPAPEKDDFAPTYIEAKKKLDKWIESRVRQLTRKKGGTCDGCGDPSKKLKPFCSQNLCPRCERRGCERMGGRI